MEPLQNSLPCFCRQQSLLQAPREHRVLLANTEPIADHRVVWPHFTQGVKWGTEGLEATLSFPGVIILSHKSL